MDNQTKPILILSDRDYQNSEIIKAFSERGYSACTLDLNNFSETDFPHYPPKAIIIKSEQRHSGIESIITRIKTHYPQVNLPVLALLSTKPIDEINEYDSILLAPYHPVQVVLRVSALIRLAEMEQEISLRMLTLRDDFYLTPEIPEPSTDNRFKILFIGQASPEFMVIINALQKEHVNVVAAFTSFTAFDFLYEQTFDTVVINGLKSTEPGFSIVEAMRKNAKLYHVPALFLINQSEFTHQDKAYQIGVNDIIDANASLTEISSRVLEQANFHRTHENLKNGFSALGGDICIDPLTSHYNRSFFNAHLLRLKRFYDALNLPVSLCLIRVNPKDRATFTGSLSHAYKQIGSMIQNLVRMHDITARLDDNTFVIAFPGQSTRQLETVSNRISSILQCAKITDMTTGKPLELDLEITFSELDENIDKQATA